MSVILAPPAASDGVQFEFDVEAPPYTEIYKCKVGPIPGAEGGLMQFNKVESRQSPNVHHMDLAILLLNNFAPGIYDCDELYAAHPSLMDETILYASQLAEQSLTLPPGIVASVPANLMTMQEIHFVNTAPEARKVYSRINAYFLPGDQVKDKIWSTVIRDQNLNIPPNGKIDEWSRCEMNGDVDLLVMSTHTHALGAKTEVFAWDGQVQGEMVYTNTDWHAPPLMDLTKNPVHVPKGHGFEVHCHFENTTMKEVHWGLTSADEMCNLALVFTPGQASLECTTVATSDGVLPGP